MDWGEGRYERVLAGVYLISWATWLAGVVWTLISQLDEGAVPPEPFVAGALFVGGALGFSGVAYLLRDRVPKQAGRLTASATNFQRAWHRLALGLELARAWQSVTK